MDEGPDAMRLAATVFFVLIPTMGTISLHGDIVHLHNGTTLEGSVKSDGDGWTVRTLDGQAHTFRADQIDSIELVKTPDPADAFPAQWDPKLGIHVT